MAVSVLLNLVLVSGYLCAAPFCAMPASNVSGGCAGMEMPKVPVSANAVSVPACCQISQAPPARTSQKATLQRSDRNFLPIAGLPAVTRSFAPADFVSQRVLISPPADQQSLLHVFLI